MHKYRKTKRNKGRFRKSRKFSRKRRGGVPPIVSNGDLNDDITKITKLNYGNKGLNELPNNLREFVNVKTLYCQNNKITELPELPPNLVKLVCSNNNLTTLSNLPNSLEELWCSGNPLVSLPPTIPVNLKYLYIGVEQINLFRPYLEVRPNIGKNDVNFKFLRYKIGNETVDKKEEFYNIFRDFILNNGKVTVLYSKTEPNKEMLEQLLSWWSKLKQLTKMKIEPSLMKKDERSDEERYKPDEMQMKLLNSSHILSQLHTDTDTDIGNFGNKVVFKPTVSPLFRKNTRNTRRFTPY